MKLPMLPTIQYQCHKCGCTIDEYDDNNIINTATTTDGLFYLKREIHLCKHCYKALIDWLDS